MKADAGGSMTQADETPAANSLAGNAASAAELPPLDRVRGLS
jgi:hypothetical protein